MKRTLVVLIAGMGLFSQYALAQLHGHDFEVGIDPVANQVKIHYHAHNFPWQLPPSHEPALPGFAQDDPGFMSLDPNEVEPGVFEPLSPQANIHLKVLTVSSPEMKVWNPLDPGGPGMLIRGENTWQIGPPAFDVHPYWHIDTSDPAYHPSHAPWGVTFQLLDLAGQHLPSDPITVTFTPEPAGAAVLLGTLALIRVRRTRGVVH